MESPLYGRIDRHLIPEGLHLIETLLWDGADYPRLEGHLARLTRSAARLDWPLDLAAVRRALAQGATGPARVRLTLDAAGEIAVTVAPLPPAAALWRVALTQVRLDAQDPWLGLKSTQRGLYDRTRAALPQGIDEVIFANKAQEVCEGTITNLFFDLGQGMHTPPLSCGVLPGVFRAQMLTQGCREAVLPLADLPRAKLWLGNALRGLIAARMV